MLLVGIWAAVTSLGVYIVVGYLPSYLIRTAGLSPADTFAANLIAVLTLASSALVGGYLIDRFPLRRVAIAVMAGVAAVAVPGFLIITEVHTLGAALLGQVMWTMVLGATYTVGTMLAMILFPVAVRFTANALAFNVGVALFGSTAPYVCTWLVATTDNPIAPGLYLLLPALAGVLATVVALPRRELAAAS
jgi:MHS family proline/betaine transporter-like MFS transporter